MPNTLLQQRVLLTLKSVAPEIDTEKVDPKQSFHDQAGIDSIDYLNFIVGLEEKFGIRIPEPDYPQLSTLDGCLQYLRQRPEVSENRLDEGEVS